MVHDNRNLNKLIEEHGNRYAATVFVGKEARRLCDQYHNVISHAEAVSWILSSNIPEGIKHYQSKIKQRNQKNLIYAKDYLSNILDDEVRKDVLNSIEKSNKVGHLIYQYRNVFDKPRQARVRILTNKIWDEMRQEGF